VFRALACYVSGDEWEVRAVGMQGKGKVSPYIVKYYTMKTCRGGEEMEV
jgi:hypothetical protein